MRPKNETTITGLSKTNRPNQLAQSPYAMVTEFVALAIIALSRHCTGHSALVFLRQSVAQCQTGFETFMNEQELEKKLGLLRTEHRDLDAAISALSEAGSSDQLQIARLKKRKLRLKDQIAIIEDTLLPDIIA